MQSASHIAEFDVEELVVAVTPTDVYTAAFESAAKLGYSSMTLYESHNEGAWEALRRWLDKRGASSSLFSFDNHGEKWQALSSRAGKVTIEVMRRVS